MRHTALLLFAATLTAHAQTTGIQGSVIDATGAVVVGASVRAVPTAGGATAATLTTPTGTYALPSLPAAEYRMRIESPGFAPAERTLNLLVGQTVTADFSLRPASSTTTVNVVESSIEVDISSSQVGGNVDPRRMTEVPLNGRNWMELSLLVPGVTVNAIGQTPLGAVSGGRFQINVDGQQVTQNSAGAGFGQPQYSREAMAQFQVITNRFDATLGRSAQIQVNAQTKSGSNELHGSAYGYFRSDRFNAADRLAQRVLPFSNQQYGGTIGGPLVRDRLWFFAAYEGERQPGTIFTQPQGFEGQSFTFATNAQTVSYLGRVDWQAASAHRLSFRVNAFTFENPFDNVGGASHPSVAAARTRDSQGGFANWTWIVSPSLVNEVKFGVNRFSWSNTPIVPSQEFRFSGITIGGPYNFPQNFNQSVQQYRDDAYWTRGSHSLKLGFEYLSNNHTGFFQQNVRGVASPMTATPANLASLFPVWNDPATWRYDLLSPLVGGYTQAYGNFTIDIPRNIFGVWLQDDWKVTRRLTLNLGLRYDNDLGVFSTPALASGVIRPRGGDNNNISPRLGFAYDLLGDRRTVIRGGGGLYYADIQANQVINQSIFNGETSLQVAAERRGTAGVDLLNPFGGVTGEDFLSGRAPVALQNIQILDPEALTPYSVQASLGVERQVGRDWSVSGDFVWWRVYREWIRLDRNVAFNPATGFPVNPSTGVRPDARFTNIQQFSNPRAAGAIYRGLQVEVQRRLAQRFALGLAYTLAQLKDSTTGPFYFPNNQFDLADEWGPSTDDQRHTLNFDGSVTLPWGLQSSVFYHFGSGNAFSSLASGNPFGYIGTNNRTFLATTRTYNDPEDNEPARAPGYLTVKRNSFRGRAINRVDYRVSKTITLKERFRIVGIAEAFNLLNAGNYGSYRTVITSANYGSPAQNLNLAYAARMLQFAARFEF